MKNHVIRRHNAIVQARIDHIPPGGNVRSLPKHLLPRRFRKSGYFEKVYSGVSVFRRLTMEGIAPTILASSGDNSLLIHPLQNRFLSLRESARFQTFPDEYEFLGSHAEVQRQVGNAVPCLLAKQLALALKGW